MTAAAKEVQDQARLLLAGAALFTGLALLYIRVLFDPYGSQMLGLMVVLSMITAAGLLVFSYMMYEDRNKLLFEEMQEIVSMGEGLCPECAMYRAVHFANPDTSAKSRKKQILDVRMNEHKARDSQGQAILCSGRNKVPTHLTL